MLSRSSSMQRTMVSPFLSSSTPSSFGQPSTSMQADMSSVQGRLSQVTLVDEPIESWSADEVKFAKFESLKNVAFGNCRLIYGSERMKFYDIVLGVDDEEKTFCVALVCSRECSSKILRTITSDCPVKAIHTMVNQLQKDTMPLLMKHGAGSQLHGQQGYTNHLTEKFELAANARIDKPEAAVDDTETLPGRKVDTYIPYGAPRGPRGHRGGHKRTRCEDDRMPDGGLVGDRYHPGRVDKMEVGEIGEDFYD